MTRRLIDIIAAILLLAFLSPLFLVIAIAIKLTSRGPVFYRSDRVGRYNKIFKMVKFRTMRTDAPAVATHLLKDAERYCTPVGPFLRKFSLDEMPQLLNILLGDMTFVGPRPALFNQDDLVALRTGRNVHTLVPGVTGWAQVNGRDDLAIPEKVEFDVYYLKSRSLRLDAKILLMTLAKVLKQEGVSH
jgi:O-antigen biosynthesis protein WbqP